MAMDSCSVVLWLYLNYCNACISHSETSARVFLPFAQVRQRKSVEHPVLARAAGAKAALDDGPEATASLKFTKGSAHKVSRSRG